MEGGGKEPEWREVASLSLSDCEGEAYFRDVWSLHQTSQHCCTLVASCWNGSAVSHGSPVRMWALILRR